MALNLLTLFPKRYYEKKMSLVRRDVVDCMVRMKDERPDPQINAHLSGQGWDDWSDADDLLSNVEHIMPEADAVFAYKPEGNAKDKVAPIKGLHERDALKRVLSYNECWWGDQRALKEGIDFGATHVVIHHANDLERWDGHVEHGIKVRHIPHCADPRWFASGDMAEVMPYDRRMADAIVTGALSSQFYPLRCHMASLIDRQQVPGVVISHPGYRLQSVADCRRQATRYAHLLGSAKLSLCCTSIYRYALAKLYESWMAGTPVCGDLPDDPEYVRLFGEVHIECDQRNARDVILAALADDDELERRAILGRQIAMGNCTPAHYCRRFAEFVSM